MTSYVHPVTVRAPFGGEAPRGLPLELVSDAVLGDVDTIELACLWSDETVQTSTGADVPWELTVATAVSFGRVEVCKSRADRTRAPCRLG